MKFPGLLFLASILSVGAAERATFDSAGGLTGLIDQGAELPIHGHLVAYFEGDVQGSLQPHDQRTPITREPGKDAWTGTVTFLNGATAQYAASWTVGDAEATLNASVTSEGYLNVAALDYVIDLPRDVFVGAHTSVSATPFSETKPADAVFFRENLDQLTITTADDSWSVAFKLDQKHPVSITDSWDGTGRHYRVRIGLHSGLLKKGETIPLSLRLKTTAQPKPSPASISVEAGATLYPFDGFGGNYCFNTQTPVVDYTMDKLNLSWARLEMKAMYWDSQRASPSPELVRDFELMRRVQGMHIPWIISLWRVPERFYADPNQKPMSAFGRRIAGEKWPELLELIGSYLTYLKAHYGAEPDFFSFNEPDLGVSVGFSAETHRDAIKLIGGHFAKLGLKTKMLLGDTANPRDSHKYTLAAAADAEAMKYVGAVSFHSWGSGTPEQYRAWAQVARWFKLPLIVGEAGTDPGSYRNRSFDSYSYGLRDAEQYQQLLRDSAPVALLYWEFTEDYGLVHRTGGSIEPTGRFWLMKHFTNLSPTKSQVVKSSSDNEEVLVSAFTKNGRLAVHILNLGPERDISANGLPTGLWKTVTTTETSGFQEAPAGKLANTLHLPARSMTTLLQQD
jgi:O-glycosyl hydrolase